MIYVDIVVNIPINKTFTYSVDESLVNELEIGKRVEVPFGNRKLIGFIVAIKKELQSSVPKEKVRSIKRIIDNEVLFNSHLFSIAKWMSDYYICPIGEVVSAMIPSGKREVKASGISFSDEIPFTEKQVLSIEQQKAVDEIFLYEKNKKLFHYLYGPTGSGKTEVFLQVAQKVLEKNKGVIYLVPEISLTTQVIEAVVKRFGNTVAVIHSGLTPSQKLSEWKRIIHKEARVVIGARSAIFAPVDDLGLIIIDEEHDSSYKSGTSPRYHARQVAMYRCSHFSIPLLMGSATPSVESWHLMQTKHFVTHKLTKRLAGGKMPDISCIDLSKKKLDGQCISDELTEEIRKTLSENKQIILFLNRRGFTHFFRCSDCGYEMVCKNCSIAMTYHKSQRKLRCHYCGWSTELPDSCPACSSLNVGYSGFGTEYIEAETKAKFPNARIIRIDTDALTKKGELDKSLNDFKNGKYDILLGTQMVAKGLNFPNLKLVGVILADTALHLPDFRAAERTFSLITQVAGRAGRFFPDGKVFVQTYNPFSTPIFCACKNDIEKFYKGEIEQRDILGFPPFSRIIRLVFRCAEKQIAEETANDAKNLLLEHTKKLNIENEIEILGPSECPILKISQNYRYQILLRGKNINYLQKIARNLIFDYTHPQNVYIECDVDPVSLL